MATLIVEGVPPGLLERIAQRAAANRRCVNSELILLLAGFFGRRYHPGFPPDTMGADAAGAPRAGSPGGSRCVGWGGDEATTSRTGAG